MTPRDFVLYAFGGSGPAHCAAYAAEVGVREVIVPLGQVASAFSAYGLASSNIVLAAELSDPAAMPPRSHPRRSKLHPVGEPGARTTEPAGFDLHARRDRA